MNLTVPKDKFVDALQKVSSIIGSRTTLPVLSNVLIKAENGSLTFETTDLEIRISTKIDASINSPGATTVPAKKMLQFAKDFPENKITIESDETNHLKINSGTSNYKLLGITPDDFPVSSDFKVLRKAILPQQELFRNLNLISYSASTDDSRKVLNGIFISLKSNTMTSVATDGKRLALIEKSIDNIEGSEGDIVVHSRAVNEIIRIIPKEGDVLIEIGEKQIAFKMGNTVLTSKLLEGNFPNYRQVIPTSFSKKIEIEKEIFYSSLKRLSYIVSETNPFIKMTFSPSSLLLSANSNEVGEGKESLKINYTGQEFAVLFNPNFLVDPLRAMTADKFIFQMNDGYSPVAITGDEGFLYIMMPVRNK